MTTPAGRALRRTIDRWTDDGMTAGQLLDFVSGIAKIEQEAADAALAGLRAAVLQVRGRLAPSEAAFYGIDEVLALIEGAHSLERAAEGEGT